MPPYTIRSLKAASPAGHPLALVTSTVTPGAFTSQARFTKTGCVRGFSGIRRPESGRRLPVQPLGRTRCCAGSVGERGAVADHVRRDQSEREEEQAEDEEAEEAVALAAGDARRPEGQAHPDDHEADSEDPPAEC